MKRIVQTCLILLLALALVAPVMAQSSPSDDGTDTAKITELMTLVDNGQIRVEAALTRAIMGNISYVAIVAACEARNIPLSQILSAATAAGVSFEVALAKMAEDGVTKNQMSAAMSSSAGEGGTGLGYTSSQQTGRSNAVVPVTSNPGGSAQGVTVSPSNP